MIFVEEPFTTLLLAFHVITQKYAQLILQQLNQAVLLLLR